MVFCKGMYLIICHVSKTVVVIDKKKCKDLQRTKRTLNQFSDELEVNENELTIKVQYVYK